MKRFLSIVLFLITMLTGGKAADYTTFHNIALPRDMNVSMVEAIEQDCNGRIWFGTNCGLFSYDGYTINYHSQRVCGSHIYSIHDVEDDALYVGTDFGLWAYDHKKGDFRKWLEGSPSSIRSIVQDGDILWLGTASGLYSYHLKKKKFSKYGGGKLGNEVIYSLLKTADDNIYIGTYNGLYYYDRQRGHFRNVNLPLLSGKSNVFVNVLAEDEARKCIWIGTGGRLYRYGTTTNQLEYVPALEHNSVKSFVIDKDGRLLIGTDNGLYVYEDNKHIQHVQHDSRHTDHSLVDDVVWTLLKDVDGNIWIGTNEGISINCDIQANYFTSISLITGKSMGNHFYQMLFDSHSNLWLGGSDGLIRTSTGLNNAVWYRVDNPAAEIAHNRIRRIYEDHENDLWICTDGGIHIWDKDHWRHINVKDQKSGRNANWAYDICEDSKGRMWIACFMGGLMVVDKQKLKTSICDCIADTNIVLPDNKGLKPFQITEDSHHTLWVLYYEDGIRKIDPETMVIDEIDPSLKEKVDGIPNYIFKDGHQRLWLGLQNKVLCLGDSTSKSYQLGYQSNGGVTWITEVDDAIWIGTRTGIWSVKNEEIKKLQVGENIVDAACYDGRGCVYLGGIDGILHGVPETFERSAKRHPIMLTAVYVNNVLKNDYSGIVSFSPDEQHIDFMVSDFPYGQKEKSQYFYRLRGIETEWNALPKESNRITFNNLDYGSYILEVSRLGISGQPEDIIQIPFVIRHPWYLRWWAITFYIILCLAFILWCFAFYRMKNRLKYERIEKEHILEQLRLRMEIQPDLKKAAEATEPQPITEAAAEQMSSTDKKFLVEINTTVEANLSDSDFNVQSLCEQVGLGNKLVYRKLKQLTGMTPVEYIRTIRLSKASILLQQKKFTISEVMYLSGFSNASYFSKCFQAKYGCTPREYAERS